MDQARITNLKNNTTVLANSALCEVRSIKTALQDFYRELQRYEKQLLWIVTKLRTQDLIEDKPDGAMDEPAPLRLRPPEPSDQEDAGVKADEGHCD